MSQLNSSPSLVSLATTATTDDGLTTPTASTACLIPKHDGLAKSNSTGSTEPDSSVPYATSTAASSTSSTSPTTSTYPTQQPKDYEQAFAALSTSYGFGGGVPTRTSKGKTDKKEKKEKIERKDKKDKGKKSSSNAGGSS